MPEYQLRGFSKVMPGKLNLVSFYLKYAWANCEDVDLYGCKSSSKAVLACRTE